MILNLECFREGLNGFFFGERMPYLCQIDMTSSITTYLACIKERSLRITATMATLAGLPLLVSRS